MAKLLFTEQQLSGFADNGSGTYVYQEPAKLFSFEEGEIYGVIWDSVKYPVTAVSRTENEVTVVYIGNEAVFELDKSGVPFFITYYPPEYTGDETGLSCFAASDSKESHSISIYKLDDEIVLKNYNGEDVFYPDVQVLKVNTIKGNVQSFTRGEAVSKTLEELDF